MAAPSPPPANDLGLPKKSKNGELTEKSYKNLINLEDDYPYFGDVDPGATLGVDPLYGPDTIPSRGPVYKKLFLTLISSFGRCERAH